MSTLVVAAHPDDEVLGCGATMAKLTAAGEAVHVLILGEGSTSRADHRSDGDTDLVSALVGMTQAAGALLGVSSVRHAGLPDNRFDSLDLLDIVKEVERAVDELSPTTVYTHHRGDLNVDHRMTQEAVLTATRPLPGSTVAEVLAFEVLSSSEWSFGRSERFDPNVFVDVTATMAAKQRALEAYAEEMRPSPHPRSHEAVAALAALRGSTIGVGAAEAFQLVRSMR